jgi:hypothetical protein
LRLDNYINKPTLNAYGLVEANAVKYDDQLQVIPVVGSERLYPTTHVFVSELVKVPIPRIHKHWGRLGFESYY